MWLSDIDLRLLRVFKAVAEAGGFVKAQSELGINQPAISSHIANLEQRLGVKLCRRGRGGFSLTPDGIEVLAEADALLGHVDEYSTRLSAIGKKSKLMTRIGVVDGILSNPGNRLPECIRNTKQKFHDMRVRVGVYDHLECLGELRARRLDICIVGVENPDDLAPEFDKQRLFDERASFFCTPDHACALTSDADECLKLLQSARISAHSFAHNPLETQLDVILQDENVELFQGNVESTIYLALSGSHVGLIPDHIAAPWVKQGKLIPVAQDRFSVVSAFHALRLTGMRHHKALENMWSDLGTDA